MKFTLITLLVGCSAVSPIEKTLQLLSDLQAKVVKDGEVEAKNYEEFSDYCHDESMDTQFAIKTGKSASERASATVAESSARIEGAATKIEELAATIGTEQADLASATKIREHEAADFVKMDADLAETVDMITRAHGIIEREMNKGAFVQGGSLTMITGALQEVMNAAAITSGDKAKVQALMQVDDLDLQPAGAPDPAAYKSQSGGIVQTLEDMLEKSKAQRGEGQKAEMNAKFNFDMLKQKLEDSMANGDKVMSETKKAKAQAEEDKAVAEGELATANEGTKDDETKLNDLQSECMMRSEEFETSQKERKGELEALGKAKSILEEKTGGASDRTYSFIQLESSAVAKASTKQDRVVAMIQGLSKDQQAPELAQLAQRIQSAQLMGADPFAKVKGMISEMIEKLVAEAAKEASHKAFCDKEMSETKAKREDKQEEVDDLQTKIDKGTAKIAKLHEEVATLESELATIAKAQSEATAMRFKEKEAWAGAKTDFEGGVEGVGMALEVLRDYYAENDDAALVQTSHDKATGAASGIIGMLEVVESDFQKMLADGTASEEMSQQKYDEMTQDNKVATAEKTTATKYKVKDIKETEMALSGNNEDIATSQSELDAILDYWEKLQPMCVAKPEPYAERKKRREAEIAGLKQAMTILEEEAGSPAFLQIRRA